MNLCHCFKNDKSTKLMKNDSSLLVSLFRKKGEGRDSESNKLVGQTSSLECEPETFEFWSLIITSHRH